MDKLKILLLEDNKWDAALIQRELTNFGFTYQSVVVHKKEDFIREISNFDPTLIITDYSLPQFDGFQAIEIAKKMVPDIPIIIVTGSLSEELAAESIKKGAWDYVVKQRLFRLESAINNSLQLQRERLQKRNAEDITYETLQKLQLIIDYSPIGLATYDSKGNIVTANQKLCDMLGYTESELTKKDFLDITHKEDKTESMNHFEEMFSQDVPSFNMEKRYITKDGQVIFVFVRAHLVRDENNQPLFMITIIENITQRKIAQKRLEISENKMKTIYNNSMDVIVVVDYKKGDIIDINNTVSNILGYNPSELIGLPFSTLFPPKDKVALLLSLDQLKIHGGIIESQGYLHKNGDMVLMDISVTEIPWGGTEALLVNLRDATERHQAQLRLTSELKEKEVMLMEIHHRVKNNMQVMASMLKMQSNRSENAKVKLALSNAQSRIYSMSLVHEAIYGEKNLDTINFSQYAKKVVQFVRHSYQSKLETIIFHYNIDDIKLNLETSVPLGQMISEIISNSLKFAFPDESKGIVSISIIKDGDFYITEISDNGISFPADINLKSSEKLGLLLIKILGKQINAEVKVDRSNGIRYVIKFKEKNACNLHQFRYFS